MAFPFARAVPSSILVGLLSSLFWCALPAAAAPTSTRDSSSTPSPLRDLSGYDIAVYSPGLVLHGGGDHRLGKAAVDSFYIYGGPDAPDVYGDAGEAADGWVDGKFQSPVLVPAVQPGTPYPSDGWFGRDITEALPFWQRSSFNSPTGTTAIWSGQSAAQQPGWVSAPGYGNNWNDWIDYRRVVLDQNQPTTLSWSFVYNHDTEPIYDFFRAQWDSAGTMMDALIRDGTNKDSLGVFTPAAANLSVTIPANAYTGPGANQIHLRFLCESDGGWSDEDGLWPTEGAVQIDDVSVDLGSNGGLQFDDFEDGFGNWSPTSSNFAGDFVKVFPQIGDIDPCADNSTPQIGFIDDGTPPFNAPGQSTGGSISAQFGYGVAGGFVLNFTGGVSGGSTALLNQAYSPAIRHDLPGPDDDDASGVLILAFDRWTHMPLANGMFYNWSIRSTTDTPEPGENPTFDLSGWIGFQDNSFVYYGGGTPAYGRTSVNVADLVFEFLTPTYLQIRLGCVDLADLFAFPGNDATPSPTFDNVSLQKAAASGPVFTARTIDLFQDSFSHIGTPASSYDGPGGPNDETLFATRIDRASAINPLGALAIAGDSLTVSIEAVVPGTALASMPVMKYLLLANPAFDHVRDVDDHEVNLGVLAGPDGGGWNAWFGTVQGDTSRTSTGAPNAGSFQFDVPFDGPFDRNPTLINDPAESRGFYPGDWFLYYLEATDTAGNTTTLPGGPGGGAEPTGFPVQAGVLLPGDYRDFAGYAYDRNWRIRALPTIHDGGGQPEILFVNDAFGFGNQPEWSAAFHELYALEGREYDDFTVMGPSSGVDNGIGSSGVHGATADQLSGYNCLLYDSGTLSTILLSDGTDGGSSDRSNDLGLLEAWHQQPAERFSAYWGDFLSSYLQGFVAGTSYLQNSMGVELGPGGPDVGPIIGGQSAPRVRPSGQVAAFFADYVAFGGCPVIHRFDDIRPLGGSAAVRAHVYDDPSGSGFPAAASVWYDRLEGGFRKVDLSFPYGFASVQTAPPPLPGDPRSARAILLSATLNAFGHFWPGPPDSAPPGRQPVELQANAPNPFNPVTTMSFFAPQSGHARLRVYDVRGRLLRTLVDGDVDPGEHAVAFDGRDDAGRALASGVYLYRLDGFGTSLTRKMTLLK